MSKRPRKPATILRHLGVALKAARFWVIKREPDMAYANLDTAGYLFAELRRAIATSGKAPAPKP